jgi:nucleotide-binding universal stress UspA family protein
LIAVDASPHSLAALRAAADLAGRVNAELTGLFVEDINLLRLAELNFVREVSHYSATVSQYNREGIEQELRAQARYLRRQLYLIGQRMKVRVTFQVVRGVIHSEVLRASDEVDLVVLGKSGWSNRRRLGSTARVIVNQAPRHALILQHGTHLREPFGLLYDGSEQAKRALALLTLIVESEETELHVILPYSTTKEAQLLQEEVSTWLGEHHLEARYRWLAYPNLTRLVSLIREMQLGTLIIPVDIAALQGEDLGLLLDEINVPALLVR